MTYEEELLKSIPVVAAMDLKVSDIRETELTLGAPLTTNINYEGTAFGGSLNTLSVLSCYLLVHHFLKQKKISFSSLVIQDSSIRYLKPVNGNFYASASFVNLDSFEKMMKRKGTSRAQMQAKIHLGDHQELVLFNGRFVAS